MDMTPPSSPPVHAGTTEAETTNAAFTRLVAVRQWLEQCEARMPAPVSPQSLSTIDQHLALVEAFWHGLDDVSGLTRRQTLANHLAQAMRDEGVIRATDGTLDERATSTINRLLAKRDETASASINASEIMLGPFAYAGGLIVQGTQDSDPALVFLPDRGWESFRDMDSLREYLRQRLLPHRETTVLPGLTSDDHAQAAIDGDIRERPITGDVFLALADRIVSAQAEKIAQAWDDYTLDRDDPDASTRFLDDIRDHQRMSSQFDISAMLDLREARLVERVRNERLAGLPANVRKDWKKARRSYNGALTDVVTLRQAVGLTEPESLYEYASRRLAEQLKAHGVTTDPRDIRVQVTPPPDPSSPLELADRLINGPAKRVMPLIDLAMHGIGQHDLDHYIAQDADGHTLASLQGAGAVRAIVRNARVSESYQAYLDALFTTGTKGAAARALARHLQTARMRFEAEEARLSYYLSDEQASLADDREEQGYRWIDALLRAPVASQREKVSRHDIVVSQMTYKGAPLTDVLVMGTRAVASASRIVIYSPGAPDGRTFREFASRQEAAREFFYHPAFREYLLDRLPAEFARTNPAGGTREFRGNQRAHWVLGADRAASYTLTEEPFTEKEITSNFLDAMYDAAVGLRKRNVRYVTRDQDTADRDAILGHPLLDAPVGPEARFIASALIEIPTSAIRTLQASWRFYDQVKAADYREALVTFAEGYTSALNIVVPPALGQVARTPLVRAHAGSRTLRPAQTSIPAGGPAFEAGYVAEGVSVQGNADAFGIRRIRGRNYVEQDGRMYPVRHDDTYGYWRLEKPQGSLDASFSGPAIERVGERWEYARQVGLHGGMRRALRDRFRRVMHLDDPAPAPQAPAAQLPEPVPMEADWHWFPPEAEHLRPQVMAALADNPGGHALVRNDGRRFHIAVNATSAHITRDGLSAELSALSIHQRRMFMHELDARFPLATERAQVMNELGLARDGRRVPSPPRSPERVPYRGDDGQVPVVSSTTADDLGEAAGGPLDLPELPSLTAAQRERWQEALRVAREHPRLPPRVPEAAPLAPGERLAPIARDQWPDRIWFYTDHLPHFGRPDQGMEFSPRQARRNPQSQTRFRVTTLPPTTEADILDDVLGIPQWRRGTADTGYGYWVEIDTRALREQQVANGSPAYDLYPSAVGHGGHRLSLRSWFHHLRLPPGSYRTGRRPD